MARHQRPEKSENGFALMGVIWLLLFAGSVTALLLMRSSGRMTEAREEGELVHARLALDGALDAIAAERLFGTADSPWLTAGTHSIDLDGVALSATISAEDQRLDVNRATPAAIDGVLQEAGVSREKRLQMLGRIVAARDSGRIASLQALSTLLADAQGESGPCLLERLTAFGGRTQRDPDAVDPHQTLQPYVPARVVVTTASAGTISAVIRSVPVGQTPLMILDWKTGRYCN